MTIEKYTTLRDKDEKIVVTEAMVEVGVEVLKQVQLGQCLEYAVKEIFLEMWMFRTNQPLDTP